MTGVQTCALPISAAQHLWDRVLTRDDRKRLGGNFVAAYQQHGTAGMWAKLRGVSRQRAAVDVGHALGLLDAPAHQWLLRELREVPKDSEQLVRDAIKSGGLVLVDWPRAAHWRRNKIRINWTKRSRLWDVFWELCLHAKAGKPIDRLTFDTKDPNFVTKQKSRLTSLKKFPIDLADLIIHVGRGTQKLDLPAKNIRLFDEVAPEVYRERTA